MIDPTDFPDLESLRAELIEVVEERLDERETVPWSKPSERFHFIRAQIVIFDTHRSISDPRELVSVLPSLSLGSVYYHVIDARRRTENGVDDFRAWLARFGDRYEPLAARLARVDPYFPTLSELRAALTEAVWGYFEGGTT